MNVSLKAGFDGGGAVYNLVDLRNKKILITGSSSGIGRGTAILLSKLGAKIILTARREEALRETLEMLEGDGHSFYLLDVRQTDTIDECVKKIVMDNGSLDGMVFCTGIGGGRPLQQFKPLVVQDMMNVNFGSFVEFVRAVTKKKRFNPGMRIVGISSIAAVQGDKAHTIYSASKAAMDGAVRCMAKELAEKDICINTVAPAMVKTVLFDAFIKKNGEDAMQKVLTRQYLGTAEVEDVASAIAFLLSGAARFITGVCLPVDGGATSN